MSKIITKNKNKQKTLTFQNNSKYTTIKAEKDHLKIIISKKKEIPLLKGILAKAPTSN